MVQFVITPRMGPDFVAGLAVSKFHGIGPRTAARMAALGIHTGADLRQWDLAALIARFGKAGGFYHGLARGQDDRPVNPDRTRKSLGAERTFETDLDALGPALAARVFAAAAAAGHAPRTVTVKVKYADFRSVTRSRSFATPISSAAALAAAAEALLAPLFPPARPVRLLGVSVASLAPPAQLGFGL